MYLDEFYGYKNQLMKDLLTHDEIVGLIAPGTAEGEGLSLAYKQCFPYEYMPDTAEVGKTFVCFDVDIPRVFNKTFLEPIIYIWAFTHKSQMRLPEGGVRIDNLCSEIAKVIDGSRYYGLGELNLYSVKRFAPMTDFQGKVMAFVARDFNRKNPTGKPIPVNRKLGDGN